MDQTRFTFLIAGIYFVCTAYLGFTQKTANLDAIHFVSQRLTSVGLVGTVLGIMLMLHSINIVGSPTDTTGVLLHGMSTLLSTTLFGMACSLLLDMQVGFVFGDIRNDD